MSWKIILAAIASGTLLGMFALAQSSKLNTSDKKFLHDAADIEMMQAHLGQMAEASASESPVRDFAKTLVSDHTSAYERLTVLANKVGASIPKGIDVRRDRSISELTHLKGNNFDKRFIRQEIRDHERVLSEFRHEASHGQDADVKAFAGKMVPIVENHLHAAEKLAKAQRHG